MSTVSARSVQKLVIDFEMVSIAAAEHVSRQHLEPLDLTLIDKAVLQITVDNVGDGSHRIHFGARQRMKTSNR